MTGQELTSQERRAALARTYAAPPATVSAKMPEIRLSVHMSKKPIEKGHFFIVDRNVDEGEDPTVTDIGTSFKCIVLRSCMKMSAFDSDNNQSLAETSEFSDFQNEQIVVIDNAGDRPVVATVAPYSIIKQMKYEPTKEELKLYRDTAGQQGKNPHPLYPVVKDLKLQYIAYVLYKPEGAQSPGVYLLKMGARGYLGMTPAGEACRYGEEAETSFIKARSLCHKETPRATHMHMWEVFASNFKTGEFEMDPATGNPDTTKPIVDHYPAFKILGQWGDDMIDQVEESQRLLKEWLMGQYGRRVSFAWRNTSDREFIPERFQQILDSATGGDEIAAVLLGDRKAAAAKSQLVTGGARDSSSTSMTTSRPVSAKQAVEDVAGELDGTKPVTAEVLPAAPKGSKPVKAPRRTRQEEEAIVAAAGTKPIPSATMQHDDPKAPGYVPPGWSDDSIEAGRKEQAGAAPSDIPPGW